MGSVKTFDQGLLTLNSAQREVVVSGGCCEVGPCGHLSNLRRQVNGVFFPTVELMTPTSSAVAQFFDRYAAAPLARDAETVAT